jgi:Cysteine-rich secretory protein family
MMSRPLGAAVWHVHRRQAAKAVCLVAGLVVTATLAQADDMAAMISQYRREHAHPYRAFLGPRRTRRQRDDGVGHLLDRGGGLSAVKTDPQLTEIAERQAKAMAAAGIMDHNVAGSFGSRIAPAHITGRAAENIAADTKTWAETLRAWQTSPGHNANLLQPQADSIGIAVARNDRTQYKTFWALVIADKLAKKERKRSATGGAAAENPMTGVKNFVCRYLC